MTSVIPFRSTKRKLLAPQARGPRRARFWLGGVEVVEQRSGATRVYNFARMARPSRNSKPESAINPVRTFFITSKTSRGMAVLQTERMANLFIEVLRSYMRAKKFKVHDFVVMPNHIHVLLSLGPELSIEKAVKLVKGNFSYRAKKELNYRWKIWQKGFSEVPVTTEASFIQHQKYIDENPVKAGLARSAEEYPYCSTYLKKKKAAAAKTKK